MSIIHVWHELKRFFCKAEICTMRTPQNLKQSSKYFFLTFFQIVSNFVWTLTLYKIRFQFIPCNRWKAQLVSDRLLLNLHWPNCYQGPSLCPWCPLKKNTSIYCRRCPLKGRQGEWSTCCLLAWPQFWGQFLGRHSLWAVNKLQRKFNLVTPNLVTNRDFVTIFQKTIFSVHKNITFSDG